MLYLTEFKKLEFYTYFNSLKVNNRPNQTRNETLKRNRSLLFFFILLFFLLSSVNSDDRAHSHETIHNSDSKITLTLTEKSKKSEKPSSTRNTPPINIPTPPILYLKLTANLIHDFENQYLAKGNVYNHLNQSVPNVPIFIRNKTTDKFVQTSSNENGEFQISIIAFENDKITIQAIDIKNNIESNLVEFTVPKKNKQTITQLIQLNLKL